MSIIGNRRPSDSHHAGIGDLVDGRYRIEGVLGRGTWSVVYRATAERTGHPIALKMLLRGLPCGDEHAEQRFFREAQITAALQHPNTLRVFDVGRTSGGALYIASEQLQGHTLEDELAGRVERKRTMSEVEALEIADSVLRSLAEAHDRGMVHRDLKPGNIVLHTVAGERVVKVLDFGIASLQGDRMTPRGVSLGTPDYMSPEQCARQDVDGRSDLYALGVILYRAVSGQVPFTGEDVFVVMKHHRETDAPDVRLVAPMVSEGLASVIDRALAKHPAERFHDARAMRAAIVRAARDLPEQPRLRAQSSSLIPRVIVSQAPRGDTGSWRVSAQDPVTAATQVVLEDTGRVRSTAKYTQVTTEALEAHRTRGPQLLAPNASVPAAVSGGQSPGEQPVVMKPGLSDDKPASIESASPPAETSPSSVPSSGEEAVRSAAARPASTGVQRQLQGGATVTITPLTDTKQHIAAPNADNKASIWPWLALVAGAATLVWVFTQ